MRLFRSLFRVEGRAARASLWPVVAALVVSTAVAQGADKTRFNIPSQRADRALTAFARQADIPILFPFDTVRRVTANALAGTYSVEQGLSALLAGTGLSATLGTSGQVVIRVRSTAPVTPAAGANVLAKQRSPSGLAAGGATELALATSSGLARRRIPEEVVVSARRVEESLQNVPVSVAVFSGQDLALRGASRGEDLMNMVPNVVIGSGNITSSSTNMTIRGMPNVGIYLDGVAQNDAGLLQQSLIELERIEVLRGPQGTLFGRNSNGGAIQLITKRPAEEFGARLRTEVGNYNRRDFSTAVDVPLTRTLLSKVTAGQYRMDGQVCSLTVPACYGGRDDNLFRADFLWTPSKDFDFRVAYDHQHTQSSDRRQTIMVDPYHIRIAAINIAAQNPAFRNQWLPLTEYTPRTHNPGYPGGEVGYWETKGDGPEDGIKTDFEAVTITSHWHINDSLSLESISGWWEKHQRAYKDIRGAEVIEGVEDDSYYWDKYWSQELHLTGTQWGGRLNWLAGLWYQHADQWVAQYRWAVPWARSPDGPDADCQPDIIPEVQAWVRDPAHWNVGFMDYTGKVTGGDLATWVPQNIPPSQCFGDPVRDVGTDYALFGEARFGLTDRLNLTLGGRWSDRSQVGYRYSRAGVPGTAVKPDYPGPIVGDIWAANVTGSTPDPNTSVWFTPKVSLDYRWTDDVMVYTSYAEGFTSADVEFVASVNNYVEVDPEIVKTLEFGIHSDWLGGTLRFNGSVFFTDWENIRTETRAPDPNNPGQYLLGPVVVTGGNAKASGIDSDLVWRPGDHWYIDFALGVLSTKYIRLLPDAPVLPGQKFPFAPDYSYNVAARYDWFLHNGAMLSARADYRYMDDYVTHPRDTAQWPQPGFGIASARLTYSSASDRWSAYLYGTNLNDTKYFTGGFIGGDGGLYFSQVGPRRQIGAGLTFTFD